MRRSLLILLFCLHVEADDQRWEVTDLFQQFKSQLEGALANLTLEVKHLRNDLTQEVKHMKNDLTQEIDLLKTRVEKLGYQCPARWEKFGGSCYYMSTTVKTWRQSREYCQDQGGDLVVITSREEQDFVVSRVGSGKIVWIGLSDTETEGEWKWVDGTPLTSPTYWEPGEPNDGNRQQDCGRLYYGREWDDFDCSIPFYWMCEKVF